MFRSNYEESIPFPRCCETIRCTHFCLVYGLECARARFLLAHRIAGNLCRRIGGHLFPPIHPPHPDIGEPSHQAFQETCRNVWLPLQSVPQKITGLINRLPSSYRSSPRPVRHTHLQRHHSHPCRILLSLPYAITSVLSAADCTSSNVYSPQYLSVIPSVQSTKKVPYK